MKLMHTVKSVQTYLPLFRHMVLKSCKCCRESTQLMTTHFITSFYIKVAFRQSRGKRTDQRRSKISEKPLFYLAIHNCKLITAPMIWPHSLRQKEESPFNRLLHCPSTLFSTWSSEDFFVQNSPRVFNSHSWGKNPFCKRVKLAWSQLISQMNHQIKEIYIWFAQMRKLCIQIMRKQIKQKKFVIHPPSSISFCQCVKTFECSKKLSGRLMKSTVGPNSTSALLTFTPTKHNNALAYYLHQLTFTVSGSCSETF